MNSMKKNIRRVFWLYFLLFALTIGYLGKFILTDSKEIVSNTYNPRLKLMDKSVLRGSIYDTNMNELAISTEPGTRQYIFGRYFAHTVGYMNSGLSAAEAKYNFTLQKPDWEMFQRIAGIFNGNYAKGKGVRLTLDAELQEMIYQDMGDRKGAAVVIEPSTGRILAMVSKPSFDPENIQENWDILKEDTDNSPLLNRSTQGLYPPGSVFKILTAAAAMEHFPDYENFTYDCVGSAEFNGEKISCFDGNAHGIVDMHKAMALSCNTYFSAIGVEVGAESLLSICEQAYFNSSYAFPLEYSRSSFALTSDSPMFELVQTSIGQGKTLVSPLHMAMITAAVANGGIMMQPYLLESHIGLNGSERSQTMPNPLANIFTLDESQLLKDLMVETVNIGTAQPLQMPNIQAAAKTGTAENASGDDHGWFIAFAPAENPKVALAILLENSGGPRQAQPLAKAIIEHVCQ